MSDHPADESAAVGAPAIGAAAIGAGPGPAPAGRGTRLSFQRKVLLAFAASLVVSVLAVTLFLYHRLHATALKDAVTYQEAYAGLLARSFSRSLDRSRTQLEFLARTREMEAFPYAGRVDPELHGLPEPLEPEKRSLFRNYLDKHFEISVLILLLPNGDVYLNEPYAVQMKLARMNLSERAYFRQVAQTRKTVVSESFLGNDGVRAVVIDVPVLDGQGNIRAHLGGVLHIADLSRFVEKSRIGPFTSAFVVDGNGTLIAHTDPEMLSPLGLSRFADHPMMAADAERGPYNPCAPPEVRTRVFDHTIAGEPYIGTLVELPNGWCFGLERRLSELEAPLVAETWHTAALVAVLILGVCGIGVLGAHRVGLRWDQAEAALRRAHDDMEAQVRQRGADLIAANAALEREVSSHKAARAELQAHRTRLEELVEARTAALQELNAKLQAEIAERSRVESELRLEEARLRSLLANAPVILFATDRNGVFTLSEGRGLADMGLRPGQVVGVSVFDVYLDRPDVCALLRRALHGESLHAQLALGSLHYETALAPLRDSTGAVSGVIGVGTDVTDRVRAEAALKQRESSLAEAQKLARLGSFEWSLKPNAMVWSAELCRMLGVDPAQTGFSYAAFLERVHPDDRARVQAEISRAVETGEAVALEHRVVSLEGAESTVDLRIETRATRSGRPERVVATVHDVTERKRAERELNAVAGRLSESNTNLLEFSYLVSHDLQEPLNTVISFSERLLAQAPDSPASEAHSQLELIRRSAVRMRDLIRQILALSKVAIAGEPAAVVDLGELVREVLDDLSARLGELGGQVEIGALPAVAADPLQMRQLFQNLIGNALKFHRPRVPPVVRVDLAEDNGFAPPPPGFRRLFVADDGIGFDPSLGARLFLPFQRLHAEGAFEGSGIGLALCKRIVERHGGTIEAAGKPGRGARFTFTLPAAPAEG